MPSKSLFSVPVRIQEVQTVSYPQQPRVPTPKLSLEFPAEEPLPPKAVKEEARKSQKQRSKAAQLKKTRARRLAKKRRERLARERRKRAKPKPFVLGEDLLGSSDTESEVKK